MFFIYQTHAHSLPKWQTFSEVLGADMNVQQGPHILWGVLSAGGKDQQILSFVEESLWVQKLKTGDSTTEDPQINVPPRVSL